MAAMPMWECGCGGVMLEDEPRCHRCSTLREPPRKVAPPQFVPVTTGTYPVAITWV